MNCRLKIRTPLPAENLVTYFVLLFFSFRQNSWSLIAHHWRWQVWLEVQSVAWASSPFRITVPPLSIHKEPDGIGRYMKELKPHLRLWIKTPFQLSGMTGCSQKGGKRGLSQHSSLDQPSTRSCIGRKNPAASLTSSRLRPFQQSNVTQEVFEMDLSALKTKWKSFHAWENASTTTEAHCVEGLKQSSGRSGRLGFDRDVCRLGERASSNRFADNSAVGKGGRAPFALVPWWHPLSITPRDPCYLTSL